MATLPIITFDENTDYDTVLEDTKLAFSEEVANDCGCGCGCETGLCDTLVYIFAADYNKDRGDQVRYEKAVEAAYKSLSCNC